MACRRRSAWRPPIAALAARVAALLRGSTLRAYETPDLAGVEVGGAIKNVLAIAAGASDGLGFGYNARAALITRGLAETGRLSAALGGQRETLMGLSGLGDLVLTCTGDLSRNRRVGLALAHGAPLADILRAIGHVAEGVAAATMVDGLAGYHGVDMPICAAVHQALHGGLPVRDAVAALLRREPRAEQHWSWARSPASAAGAGEALLAPGFVHGHGNRVRQVEAAHARAHRNGAAGAAPGIRASTGASRPAVSRPKTRTSPGTKHAS